MWSSTLSRASGWRWRGRREGGRRASRFGHYVNGCVGRDDSGPSEGFGTHYPLHEKRAALLSLDALQLVVETHEVVQLHLVDQFQTSRLHGGVGLLLGVETHDDLR